MSEIKKIVGVLRCFKDQCLSGTLCNKECDYCKPADEFSYCDFATAIDDSVELLKLHEPRVMSLEEARSAMKNNDIVWFEIKDKLLSAGVRIHDADYFEMQTGEVLDIADLDNEEYAEMYGKEIRAWTSKPTEDQRKEEKWDGQE